MEQKIRNRFNENILKEAMRRYGIAPDSIKLLDGFESYMYEFERSGQGYILRLGHSLRRSEALIQGEVDWINTLSDGGVTVARAILSERGKLVEAIDDDQGGAFLATAFIKAPGRPAWEVGWTPERYQIYGRTLARMHVISETYQPADPTWRRPEWDDPSMEFAELFLPTSETTAQENYRAVLAHLYSLPVDSSSYGLIHQDAHQGNFLMDEDGSITLFDFDDCVYSWYANDIAIVLFYMTVLAKNPIELTDRFMKDFLRGYCQVRRLDPAWLKEIPWFLKLREIDLYAVIHRDFDLEHIEDNFAKRFMDGRKQCIDQNTPVIDYDFNSLAAFL